LVSVCTLIDVLALIAVWEAILHERKLSLSLLTHCLADMYSFSQTMHGYNRPILEGAPQHCDECHL